jgi:hypothetical protein
MEKENWIEIPEIESIEGPSKQEDELRLVCFEVNELGQGKVFLDGKELRLTRKLKLEGEISAPTIEKLLDACQPR